MANLDFATSWLDKNHIEYSSDMVHEEEVIHFEYDGLKYNIYFFEEGNTYFITHSEYLHLWLMGKILSAIYDILERCLYVRPRLHAERGKLSLQVTHYDEPKDPGAWIESSIEDIKKAVELLQMNVNTE